MNGGTIKTQISNLVRTTRFWNKLHQVSSNPKDWKPNFKVAKGSKQNSQNRTRSPLPKISYILHQNGKGNHKSPILYTTRIQISLPIANFGVVLQNVCFDKLICIVCTHFICMLYVFSVCLSLLLFTNKIVCYDLGLVLFSFLLCFLWVLVKVLMAQ